MATDDNFGGFPPLPPGFSLDDPDPGVPAIAQVPAAVEMPAFEPPKVPTSMSSPVGGANGFAMPESYIDAVKKFEGYAPKSTWDYKQYSVGYGTRGAPGERITPEVADARLRDELSKAAKIVEQHAPDAPEGVKAALTSLTFNAGSRWTTSGLGDAVRKGDYDRARSHFLRYTRAGGEELPGLVSRRQQEASWFDVNPGTGGRMALGGPTEEQPVSGGSGDTNLAGGAGADALPPLPPGFTLDGGAASAATAGAESNLPPLPAGFTLDGAEPEKKKEDKPVTFTEAFGRGVDQMQGMLYGGVEAVGEATGSKALTQFGKEGRERNKTEAEKYGSAAEFLKIRGIGDFTQWAKETIGSQIPIMGPMLGGGAIGALVGGPIGGLIGAFAPGFVMSTGEVQSNIKEKDPNAVAPSSAFVGGAAIAALDAILPGKIGAGLVRRFGAETAEEIAKRALSKPVTDSILKRGAKGVVTGMAVEGVTEAIQEAIGDVSAAYGTGKPLDPELGTKMIEAGAAGALLGGIMGPMGAPVQSKVTDDETPAAAPPATPSPAQAAPSVAAPQASQPVTAPARPPSVPQATAAEIAVLRDEMGYSPEDIADMPRAQIDAELADAASKGIKVPAKAADQPSAEPVSDLTAQIADLRAGQRQGVYLSPDNVANVQSNPAFVDAIAKALNAAKGAEIVENVDGKGGMLVAKDKATADSVRTAMAEGADPQTVLGTVTGAGTGKAADADTVVQQRTPEGAVTRETVVPAAEAPAAAEALAAPGRTVETMPVGDAVARREEGIAKEAAATTPVGDGSRASPVKVEIPEDVELAGQRVAEPTEAQKEAGNYTKGHVKLHGLDITIENRKGSIRRGKDADGKAWEVTMPAAYGYAKRTLGKDGDQVDIYIGDDPASDRVWVVDQVDAASKAFDEHKAMLGFPDRETALAAYQAAFSDGKGAERIGAVTEMPVQQFRAWAREGKKTKPLGDIAKKPEAKAKAKSAPKSPETALAFIRNAGGIAPDADLRQIADGVRIPGLFNKKGVSPDDMLRLLEGENFIQDRSGPNQTIDTSLQDLYDLVGKIVNGERVGKYGETVERPKSKKEVAEQSRREILSEAENLTRELGVDYDLTETEENRLVDLVENDYMDVGDALERVAIEAYENEREGSVDREADAEGRDDGEAAVAQEEAPEPGEDAGRSRPAESQGASEEVTQAPSPGPSDSGLGRIPQFADAKALVKDLPKPMTAFSEYIERKGFPGWAKMTDEQKVIAYNDLKKMYGAEASAEPAAKPADQSAKPVAPAATKAPRNLPDGITVELSDTRLKGEEARLKGGEYKAIARRERPAGPYAVEDGYGNTPDEAITNALRKFSVTTDALATQPYRIGEEFVSLVDFEDRRLGRLNNMIVTPFKAGTVFEVAEQPRIDDPDDANPVWEVVLKSGERKAIVSSVFIEESMRRRLPGSTFGQTSLVPEATTSEKIKAEEKAKSEKGKSASDDSGPLFNPDAGKQTDLVDLAKVPVEAENPASLNDLIADTKRKTEFAESAIRAELEKDAPRLTAEKNGMTRLLTKAPGEDGFRITTLEGKEPIGHRDYKFDDEGVKNAARDMISGGLRPPAEPAKQPDTPKPETSETVAKEADTKADTDPLAPLVVVLRGSGFKTIVEARKFVKEAGILPSDATNKQIDETVEAAVVAAARQIVAEGKSPAETFKALTGLYQNQPNLASRTGTSVANQAYSTPMPLAFVASRLAGVKAASEVYEPTAGNGALLIEADPAKTYANEIDPDRAAALKKQGFTVTSKDGAEVPSLTDIDSVIMNPPFGAVKEGGKSKTFTVGDWNTTQIDHAVALNALDAMADDGKAVLILGGTKSEKMAERRKDYRGKAKREFYFRLYDQYNVTDHFTVSGDLYTKQGASWPVDVIVIEGRGKSARELPAANPPTILKTWDEIGAKLDGRPDTVETGAVVASPDRAPARREQPTSDDGSSRQTTERGRPERVQPEAERDAGAVRAERDRRESDDVRGSVEPDAAQPRIDRDSGRTDRKAPAEPVRPRVKRERQEGASQAPYEPVSTAKSLDTLIPINMADAARNAMERVAERNGGSVDRLVADRLGYSEADLSDYFSAEQVDAIAAAIDNVERGAAFIIGSQTGVGKGRVAAGMLRYAMKRGMTPVFVTEKPDLYGDIYRDLRDIGVPEMLGREPRMFITNAGETITLDEEALAWKQEAEEARANGEKLPPRRGKFLTGGTAAKVQDTMRKISAGEDVADIVLTTYDQMNTVKGQTTPRRQFLSSIAPRAMIVSDESHNAGGAAKTGWKAKDAEQNRSEFMRDLASRAQGIMFSSATYAKRPDVMDLYARTDMGKAVDDPKDLPELIQRGGVPMQQIVASMLAESGQYVRQERSFDGVEYALTPVEVDQRAYKHFSASMQAIFRFDLEVEEFRKEWGQDALDQRGMAKSKDGGVGSSSASSIGFSSLMHNITNQMLLAIKAEATAKEAIEAHKRGEKPVIALANTNESFIRDFAAQEDIKVGDALDLDFGAVLERYLERTLRVTIKHPDGKTKEHLQIPETDLPASVRQSYREALNLVRDGDYEALPISPIDWIRYRLGAAGMSVKEVTGRQTMIDYSQPKPKYIARPKNEQGASGKRGSIANFNAGRLDALILNRSGSTGVSMHASQTFKDKRKRRMILAQAEGNIDTHLQMLGRVHRTGQVLTPSYSQIAADIPAEARPTAVLMKKMASLNANTTGARSSNFTVDSVDFMNEVGDKVVAEHLIEDPELNDKLGEPLTFDENNNPKIEDVSRKATGRLVLLDVEVQAQFLDAVQKAYKAEIEQLDALGENPLEAKTVDIQAKTLETTELKPATGEGPFLDAVRIEKVSAKAQGRAMPASEVVGRVSEFLKVEKPSDTESASLASLEARGRGWRDGEVRRVTDLARRQIAEEVAATKPDSRGSVRQRAEATVSRWQSTMAVAYPGARVKLAMPAGDLNGVVLSVERTGKAKQIAALGAWTVKIAVPDSMRMIEFPMSKLFPDGVVKGDEEKGATITRSPESHNALVDAFEAARKEGRETRYIVTGNILGGYDQTRGKGRIVNFTTDTGDLRPGILMGREFQLGMFMEKRRIRFPSGATVAEFVSRFPGAEVTATDGDIAVSQARGTYRIEMASARAKAGKFFTDADVRRALGGKDFERRGTKMIVDGLSKTEVAAAIDEMKKIGAAFETNKAQDEAQAIVSGSSLSAALSPETVIPFLKMGRSVQIPERVVQAVHGAIADHMHMVPENADVLALSRIVPGEKLANGDRKLTIYTKTGDGTEISMPFTASRLRTHRAFRAPVGFTDSGRPAIVLLRLDVAAEDAKAIRGELWHELIHHLRSSGLLSGIVWDRLLAHANGLRLLDGELSTYLRSIGFSDWQKAGNGTLREEYSKLYRTRPDFAEIMDQEAVTHFVELASHGDLLPMEIDPVRDILTDIWNGAYSGKRASSRANVESIDAAIGTSMRGSLDRLGYYSQALESVQSLKQTKGTPEQMLAQLKKAGVKDAEIEATGLRGFLEGKKAVTRDEIIGYLEENRINLAESRRETRPFDPALQDEADRIGDWRVPGTQGETVWSQYTLDPDNPTYRETVLHLPETGDDFRSGHFPEPNIVGHMMSSIVKLPVDANFPFETQQDVQGRIASATGVRRHKDITPAAVAQAVKAGAITEQEAKYYSYAASRAKISGFEGATDPSPSVYLIDQIQSDWGQKLRDGGVRDEKKIAELKSKISNGTQRLAELRNQALEDVIVRPATNARVDGFYDVQYKVDGDWRTVARRAPISSPELDGDMTGRKFILNAPTALDSYMRLSERAHPDYAALARDVDLWKAELATAEVATPGNPLVNTTDQWVNTTLRRAIRQAAEANTDYIAIPSGDTVLSYNPGNEHGMQTFYDKIVPKNLRNLLRKLDPDTPAPIRTEKMTTPTSAYGRGKGFSVFPLTNVAKWAAKSEGQPMFSAVPSDGLTTSARDRKETIERQMADAISLVTRMTGPEAVRVSFEDHLTREGMRPDQMAALSGIRTEIAGRYTPSVLGAKPLIQISLGIANADLSSVAAHEAYHHVEERLATPKVMHLLRSKSEMERAKQLARQMPGMTEEFLARQPDWEIRAIAFQRFAHLMGDGRDPGPLHIGVRRFWMNLIRIARNIANVLKGQGFTNIDQVFRDALSGEMRIAAAQRRAEQRAKERPASRGLRLDRQMTPEGYVDSEPFDINNVRVTGRSVEFVPLANIRTIQKSVGLNALKSKLRYPVSDDGRLPSLFHWDGLYYVNDGNHRIEGARVNEQDTIRAEVISLTSVDSPRQTDIPAQPVVTQEDRDGTSLAANDNSGSSPDRTDSFRQTSDDIDAFVNQRITPKDGASASVTDIYEAYLDWSHGVGAEPMSLQSLTSAIDDMGYRRMKVAGRMRYVGVSIVGDQPSPQPPAPPSPATGSNVVSLRPSGSQGTMASVFPSATSPGTFFGRKAATVMRRMAPRSDQWRVRLQDRFLMVRRQQEAIEEKSGAELPLPLDVYQAEALYHGKTGEQAADLQEKFVEPLVDHMRQHEIDGDQLGEYLYARHAGERNAYIRRIDPGNDAGSGMTDADAQAILARVANGPKASAFAEAARMVDGMNKLTRDRLLASGLISRETYDAWESDYQHYVPLRGFEVTEDEDSVFPRVGRGFNVRGPEAMRALGRRSKSDNPVAYVILQAQQAIVRAEKNRVNKTLLRLVETHPDADVWEVYRGEHKRTLVTDPLTGEESVRTVFVPPQFSAHDPSILGVKVGGKQLYIRLNNPNLARAMKGVGSSDLDHAIVRNMMKLTRFYAQLLTSWNPEFVVGNYFRDVQTALINSKDVQDLPEGARKKMLAEALSLKSIRGIYNALRGDGSSEFAQYFEEFRQAGGKVSFMEYNDIERIKSRMNSLLTEGKTRRAFRQAMKYVEDVNTSVENGVRLSTYIAMRKAGIPQARAAYVARELTVNFNRKGEWGPIINSAYMFFNASVQGSTRMLQAIARSKSVRRAVYAIAFGGFAMEILNYLISGDDDDGENAYDKIKPWVKERNMIFMLPGRSDYLMIPMPYGYNVPFVAGQKIAELSRSVAGHGKLTPAKAASGIMAAMMGSFNPLGTSPTESFLQMVSPTILDPVVQVAENKTWFGGAIYPTKYDKRQPDSESYFSSVHPAFVSAARWMNAATGGNAARSGMVDVSPEVLEHYAQFVGGGLGKFLLNATGSGQRALTGEEFVPEKTPIIRRLYGKQTDASRRGDFYEKFSEVDAAYYEVRQMSKAGDETGAQAARKEYAAELKAYGAMKGAQKTLSQMTKEKARIQLNRAISDADKKAKLEAIKERENKIIVRALEVYARAKKAEHTD